MGGGTSQLGSTCWGQRSDLQRQEDRHDLQASRSDPKGAAVGVRLGSSWDPFHLWQRPVVGGAETVFTQLVFQMWRHNLVTNEFPSLEVLKYSGCVLE